MSRNYAYEKKCDLIAALNNKRGTTAVVNKSNFYNDLGIPAGRLTAAMGANNYAYDYDNIGNRKTAQEETDDFTYTANTLNQYTQITENSEPFAPEFNADGNQTRIKTATGIWTAIYNDLNRPVTYTRENEDGTLTVITADYDYMGRRVFKKVETVTPADPDVEDGEETRTIITNHRFLYRGYLQIAALDLPKNITEVYGTNGSIKTAYTYSPYGLATSSGNVTQPLQWSSEYADTDLGLIYYNYRHYNPLDGRWTGRDGIGKNYDYVYSDNIPALKIDRLGLWAPGWEGGQAGSVYPPYKLSCTNYSSCLSECPSGKVSRRREGVCEYRTSRQRMGYYPKANGCGAEGSIGVPGSYKLVGPRFDFTAACNRHDICYGTCGSDKGSCDRDFYSEMVKICINSIGGFGDSLVMLPICEVIARTYYEAVDKVGGFAYDDAQTESCEWERC